MIDGDANGDYDQLLDQVQALLEEGKAEEALEIAQRALEFQPKGAAGWALAGMALLEADRYRDAQRALAEALRLAPDDSEIATLEAAARFILGDQAGAEHSLRQVTARAPVPADAYYWLGLIRERCGDYDQANRLHAQAVSADPDNFHAPCRIERAELERELQSILESLPTAVREALRDLPIVIEDLPSPEILAGYEERLSPDILGLFVGASLAEQSVFDHPGEPNAVYLFKRNLERIASSREQLLDEARLTLIHEIGHFLGLDEEELEDRDLA